MERWMKRVEHEQKCEQSPGIKMSFTNDCTNTKNSHDAKSVNELSSTLWDRETDRLSFFGHLCITFHTLAFFVHYFDIVVASIHVFYLLNFEANKCT